VVAGKELLGRLSQIVTAGRGNDNAAVPHGETPQGDSKPTAKPDAGIGTDNGGSDAKATGRTGAKAVAAAAEAFAERVRTKVHGLAA
jgi:hypothetical protein